MAKSFDKEIKKRNFITVINSSDKKNEKPNEETNPEEGRGVAKEQEPKYIPRSIKIRSDIWDKSQALAWWDRESLQEFFTKVLENHITSIPEAELNKIIQKYNKK